MRVTSFSLAAFLLLTLPALTMAAGQNAAPKSLKAYGTRANAQDLAIKLFRRLTGVPILPTDPRLGQMTDLIQKGQAVAAAALATEDPNFYQVTVKNLAAKISSQSETPYIGLDDFQATFIGTVRDEIDARLLLSGNYLYRAKTEPKDAGRQALVRSEPSRRNNTHFEQIDKFRLEYKSTLEKQEPQWQGTEKMTNHAGLMTTRGWGWNYDAGTNRRAVLYTFDRFLCKPIAAWKVPGLPENAVARDVPRNPSQNPALFRDQYEKVFQQQCLTCHGGLDPMRDAFSSLDFLNSTLVELRALHPAPKYKRGYKAYPEGHITLDDRWNNPIAPFRPELGFKPEQTQGQGVQAFGEMIANATAFNSCMVQRVFGSVCQRNPGTDDRKVMDRLSLNFEKNGHNLKKLFEETAASPECLETVGVKNFRSIYYSLSRALDTRPTDQIDDYYQNNMSRLPKDGHIDEISPSMLLAVKGLVSLYCNEFAKNNPNLSNSSTPELLSKLSQRIYGRELTPDESGRITELLIGALKSERDPTSMVCTVLASSVDFLVQ